MKYILTLLGIALFLIGGFVLDDEVLTLIAFLIGVLCFGFVGIIEAIEGVDKRIGGEKHEF